MEVMKVLLKEEHVQGKKNKSRGERERQIKKDENF